MKQWPVCVDLGAASKVKQKPSSRVTSVQLRFYQTFAGFRNLNVDCILLNSMTSISFVFTELANTMKYGGGFLYNLVFTEWRHCVLRY